MSSKQNSYFSVTRKMWTCDVGRSASGRFPGVRRSLYLKQGVRKKRLAACKTEQKQMRENALPCAARFRRLNEGVLLLKSAHRDSAPSSSASPVSLATAAILSALCIVQFFFFLSPKWHQNPGRAVATPLHGGVSKGAGGGGISCEQWDLVISRL